VSEGKGPGLGRRDFMGAAALGTGAAIAGLAATAARAQPAPATRQVDFPDAPGTFGGGPAGTNNRA
jgi:hypothetical protein